MRITSCLLLRNSSPSPSAKSWDIGIGVLKLCCRCISDNLGCFNTGVLRSSASSFLFGVCCTWAAAAAGASAAAVADLVEARFLGVRVVIFNWVDWAAGWPIGEIVGWLKDGEFGTSFFRMNASIGIRFSYFKHANSQWHVTTGRPVFFCSVYDLIKASV